MPRQSSDVRGQLSTAAASAKRDAMRAVPRIAGSGPAATVDYDRTLAGRSTAPLAPGSPTKAGPAAGSSGVRPRLRMPGGGDAA